MSKRNEWIGLAVGVTLALALTCAVIFLCRSPAKKKGDTNDNASPSLGVADTVLRDDSAPDVEANGYNVNIEGFSAAYNSFLSNTVFVGDSICSGISVYKYLPEEQVLAKENLSVRAIDDYAFKVDGVSCDYVEALQKLSPKTVIFIMGMNDTYTSEKAYCENYKKILEAAHEAVPDAKLYVTSITPIASKSDYTTNAVIDSFNSSIEPVVKEAGFGYIDISTPLQGANNALQAEYSGSDGIHLPSGAYRVILENICDQLVK